MADDDNSQGLTVITPGQSAFQYQAQGHDCIHIFHYQTAQANPAVLEAFCYTDKVSYQPGERVSVHASSTGATVDFQIYRDGIAPVQMSEFQNIAVPAVGVSAEFYARGCDWPVALQWVIPADARSGFYIIRVAATKDGKRVEHEHGFCVRAKTPANAILFVLSTCTWAAYNDWGGANNYVGLQAPPGFHFAPRLTTQRPYARGLIWLPKGAPRIVDEVVPGLGDTPRYPSYEWAYAKGFCKFYAGAGWATYDRQFALWTEQEGMGIDYATQHDLDQNANALDGYRCVVTVGHCEYWSARMRDVVDAFVERGGNAARFAGNFGWQIRLEEEGRTQVCYKELANAQDPLAGTDREHLTTSLWEDPIVGRPGSLTFGLSAIHGVYARVGAAVPRGAGGFTVYRPEHWAFAESDLYFGDMFGSSARIFGFEVDGLEYDIRDGLPFPKHTKDMPPGLEILAMGLASPVETDHALPASRLFIGDAAAAGFAKLRYGDSSEDSLKAVRRGNGMIVSFKKGAGEVFHAGSSEWVNGLRLREPVTESITRTVLKRFSSPHSPV
jgi:hypothetical protein